MTKLALALAATLFAAASYAQEPPRFSNEFATPFDAARGVKDVDPTTTFSIGRMTRKETVTVPGSVLSNGQIKSSIDAMNDRQNYGGR